MKPQNLSNSGNGNAPQSGLRKNDIILAYILLRLIVGVNYFNHGFTRMGSLSAFAQAMVERFQDTFIPPFLVQLNALMVPPIELVVGLLITIGLFTRGALVATLLLMLMLMYGITLVQDWSVAGGQLIYDLILALLLAGVGFNRFSVDDWLARRRSSRRQQLQQ